MDIEECSARERVGGNGIVKGRDNIVKGGVKGGDDIVKGGVDFHFHANVSGLAGVVVTFGVRCR